MPNKPKGHAAMAASICVVCFRKPKTLRPISESVNGMMKSLILPQFQTDSWSWLPTKICAGCHSDLRKGYFRYQICSETCRL